MTHPARCYYCMSIACHLVMRYTHTQPGQSIKNMNARKNWILFHSNDSQYKPDIQVDSEWSRKSVLSFQILHFKTFTGNTEMCQQTLVRLLTIQRLFFSSLLLLLLINYDISNEMLVGKKDIFYCKISGTCIVRATWSYWNVCLCNNDERCYMHCT